MPHRLEQLLAPRSIAIIGASDRNSYANLAMQAVTRIGYDGRLHLVNRRGVEAFGRPTSTSCVEIGEPVDAAYLCVPAKAVMEAAEDAIAAGIRNLVVVASGFAEIGGEGQEREEALRALCLRSDTRVLGPNCLGYRNVVDRVALGSIPYTPQPGAGSVALVSASGSVAAFVASLGVQQGVGFTHVVATGNEMNVDTADLVDYLVEVPEVRAVALFLESVKDATQFARVAERARELRKPIVVLKVGAAEATAAVAVAHTGAVVGDDRVFDAACDRWGVVRVPSVEALVATAATLAATGPLARPGVAYVSISGGMSEIASDLAEKAGVALPRFSEQTRARLSEVLSDLGGTENPLDLTGAAVRDDSMWRTVPRIVADDPSVGLTLLNWDVPAVPEPTMPNTLQLIGETLSSATAPTLLITNYARPINEQGAAYLDRYGIAFALPGLAEGMAAVGRLAWWSERVLRPAAEPPTTKEHRDAARPGDEQQALAHLERHGVPIIPQTVVHSAAEAALVAASIDGPVVLKVVLPDIAHKSELGGVALGLTDDAQVAGAYNAIMDSVAARAPDARIDGVLVAPMRTGGLELLVGVARDPVWGLVLAVGMGGVWVEALDDTALCLLPTDRDTVLRAWRSLRAARLLDGYRGAPPVDLERLVDTVLAIAEAAGALGPDLAALEVNPLSARGSEIEALDALVVWRS